MYEKSSVNKVNKNFSIQTFFSNLQYLFKYRIKDITEVANAASFAAEHLKYELQDDFNRTFIPKIKSPFETIEHLINSNNSICRYGDGEFALMLGEDIPFQKADKELQQRLKDIFVSEEENILVAAPYFCFSSLNEMRLIIKNWVRQYHVENEDVIKQFFNPHKIYYDTAFTQLNILYKNLDFNLYFNKLRNIWKDKDITIICGEGLFDNIKANIFDNTKSISFLYAPRKDAFFEYDNILKDALKTDKNSLKILILGPTATVLAYDIAKNGHRALDMGHIAKSYDWYINKIDADFYSPD